LAYAKEFVPINKTDHDLKRFDCGKPDTNTFLHRFAVRHSGLISQTWVLTTADNPASGKARIASYYTLANSTVRKDDVPYDGSLPRYPVPTVLLARLAVDREFHGQRLGEKTLVTALRKAADMANAGLPAIGVVLDVLDEDALAFYQKFDMFEPFTDNPMRLFTSMQEAQQI